ncbi:hypothetical protein GRI43_00055 [Altererythrobacter luteolus]|uniref:Tryptophan halogenase n=1 Tax=Pontixanthobacter luteolus TaxID=295089 RepID=A0A6I4UW69_9SPHN|nr:tryptophan 7-halogenase [Pontixanthobacter luteolus]MXP45783.1 hypothetical protein [Pontixanthobacter luteolus]
MTDQPHLAKIALFGASGDVWPVAALLAGSLPDQTKLTIVETSGSGIGTNGAMVVPAAHRYFERSQIDIADLLKRSDASVGIGITHLGWLGAGSELFLGPSGSMPKINGVPLHQIMLRAAMLHDDRRRLAHLLEPFRLPSRAAAAGKLSWPAGEAGSPKQMLGPQIQIGMNAFAEYLRGRSTRDRFETLQGIASAVATGGENTVRSVLLEDGREIAADIFIDLSGEISDFAVLEQGTHPKQSVFEFPFSQLRSGFIPAAEGQRSFNPAAEAIEGGLMMRTTLPSGTIIEALASETGHEAAGIGNLPASDMTCADFRMFSTADPWSGNLVRMGTAACALGPYHSADRLLLLEQALHFAELLPASANMAAEAQAYNARQAASFSQVRDRVLAPFLLNHRTDAAWTACREVDVPESLRIRMDQFAARGRLVTFEHEITDEQEWIDLFIGFGLIPDRCDPLALTLDMQKLVPVLGRIASDLGAIVAAMPDHKAPFRAQG